MIIQYWNRLGNNLCWVYIGSKTDLGEAGYEYHAHAPSTQVCWSSPEPEVYMWSYSRLIPSAFSQESEGLRADIGDKFGTASLANFWLWRMSVYLSGWGVLRPAFSARCFIFVTVRSSSLAVTRIVCGQPWTKMKTAAKMMDFSSKPHSR